MGRGEWVYTYIGMIDDNVRSGYQSQDDLDVTIIRRLDQGCVTTPL